MDKKRILVIDDEQDLTKLIKLNLEKTGKYEVRTEHNGLLGVIAAKQFKPNLILLDIMMPGVDGVEVCNRLDSEKDTKGIPIVFLTALISAEEVNDKRGIIAGHPFIAKPIDIEQLIDAIEKNLSKQ